ncbi:MAG: TldD/PmbA family protein [Symbiobacteriaceae bacterium]|nr:TldD/PmbA family protein [Symbiobacteriaceae bacterium]
MYNKDQIYVFINKALGFAAGYQAQVAVSSSAEGLSRIANSEIHQNVFEDRTSLAVTIIASHKTSSISTNVLSDEGIQAAVAEAIANLALLPDGEETMPLVSEPKEMETRRFSQELHDKFTVETRAQLVAEGLSSITEPYKAFGQLSYRRSASGMGNSAGIRRYSDGNSVRFTLLISDDLGGTGYANMSADSLDAVDMAGTFAIAKAKAEANKNPIELEPGAYTVILEPLAVNNLLGTMMRAFNGGMVNNKMSPLTDKIGEKVFSEKLTVVDDWTSPYSPGLAFDGEGTPRTKLTLIEQGVAKDLAYDQASAKKAGTTTTGHAGGGAGRRGGASPANVIVSPGEKTLAEIIAGTEKALLVTRFHYMNPVNMRQAILTGITRDGFFLVENGKITKAVRNMRFTESMLIAMNNIEEISSDRKRTGASFIPGMKINGFHFTGKTSFSDTGEE